MTCASPSVRRVPTGISLLPFVNAWQRSEASSSRSRHGNRRATRWRSANRAVISLATNVVSELLRPSADPAVEPRIAKQDAGQPYPTAITKATLRLGAAIVPERRRKTQLPQAMGAILREEFRRRILPSDSCTITGLRRRIYETIRIFDRLQRHNNVPARRVLSHGMV